MSDELHTGAVDGERKERNRGDSPFGYLTEVEGKRAPDVTKAHSMLRTQLLTMFCQYSVACIACSMRSGEKNTSNLHGIA